MIVFLGVITLTTFCFYCIHRKVPFVLLNILNVLSLSTKMLYYIKNKNT